tara:strand:- start:506 stop:1069 length:564 start_codon:yes stop_codon:yes gene_type:complete
MASIGEGLKYPFKKFGRLFNYWWFLVPVWGWFVVPGYLLRMINEVVKGKNKELPAIRPFKGLFSAGFFFIVLVLILAIIVNILLLIPVLGWLIYIYYVLIAPILYIQFAQSMKFSDGLNIVEASKTVFGNFGKYLWTYVKMFIIVIILLVASIPLVTLVVTLPAMGFVQNYMFADFYREIGAHKGKK